MHFACRRKNWNGLKDAEATLLRSYGQNLARYYLIKRSLFRQDILDRFNDRFNNLY